VFHADYNVNDGVEDCNYEDEKAADSLGCLCTLQHNEYWFAFAARSTTMITASKDINKSHGQLDRGASVTIMNQVGGFITLECSSKDNNLSIHEQKGYYFSFTPNDVGTTLFRYNVMWQHHTVHVVVECSFAVCLQGWGVCLALDIAQAIRSRQYHR